MSTMSPDKTKKILAIQHEITAEYHRAREKFGQQSLPDGTEDNRWNAFLRAQYQKITDRHASEGTLTWADILSEEYAEVLAEDNWLRIRAELIQVAGVVVSWIEDGDKRHG